MNMTANYTRPVTGLRSADIDFDTRLALASVGADVLLSQHGTEEAHAAVTAAVAEASGYGTAVPLMGALAADQSPETFRSHPILKLAGDLIRARGWVQHRFEDESGRLCTLGAVSEASSRMGESADYYDATQELIRRIGDVAVAAWNDHDGRTVDDVLLVLR